MPISRKNFAKKRTNDYLRTVIRDDNDASFFIPKSVVAAFAANPSETVFFGYLSKFSVGR
jgi:hypothetical protein